MIFIEYYSTSPYLIFDIWIRLISWHSCCLVHIFGQSLAWTRKLSRKLQLEIADGPCLVCLWPPVGAQHGNQPRTASNKYVRPTEGWTREGGRGVRVVISSGTQLDNREKWEEKRRRPGHLSFRGVARQYVKTTTWKPFKMNINCRVKWCGSGVSDGMIY